MPRVCAPPNLAPVSLTSRKRAEASLANSQLVLFRSLWQNRASVRLASRKSARPALQCSQRVPASWQLSKQVSAKLHRSEEHTSELQSPCNLVCRLLLEKKKLHSRYLASSTLRTHPSNSRRPPTTHRWI